jgi:pyruvate dehydrogenase E1 component alpha subunit/2-oxoisovalerate dehydrogenase E1 component alpha subunit
MKKPEPKRKQQNSVKAKNSSGNGVPAGAPFTRNAHGIPDWRLEKPDFRTVEVAKDGDVHYEVRGDLSAPVPPIRDSKYLKKEQCIELYRWMLIRNQGALLVRGFHPRDVMMQYMAKADSPTKGKDGTSHYGDIEKRNMVSPISMLGDLIPVMAGVALGARMQGRELAVLTWIGDGGQSTGVTHEGLNFAAVRKLGLVLVVENNLWAYSTPTEYQFAVKDLANRAIGYGIPGVIIDGTDACQVYDATYEAVERAHRGEGASLIEAKMMRMKGHAIHDAAAYVPKEMFEYWRKRDPITRFEKYLLDKKWVSAEELKRIADDVQAQVDKDRDIAVASPMPNPEDAATGVYCEDGCHTIKPKYATPKTKKAAAGAKLKESEAAIHFK